MANRKRWMAIGVLLLMMVSLGAALWWLEQQRTPDWRQVLDEYLYSAGLSEASVQVVGHAARPEAFGESGTVPVATDWVWSIEQIPSPPEELYCVLLAWPDDGSQVYKAVYVGYHNDGLWRSGWLVHDGRAGAGLTEIRAQFRRVDCEQAAVP